MKIKLKQKLLNERSESKGAAIKYYRMTDKAEMKIRPDKVMNYHNP